jgi:dephospho-CoA kinase
MAAQLPDVEKIKAADYVIDNSGTIENTRQQVEHVWEKLRNQADAVDPPSRDKASFAEG